MPCSIGRLETSLRACAHRCRSLLANSRCSVDIARSPDKKPLTPFREQLQQFCQAAPTAPASPTLRLPILRLKRVSVDGSLDITFSTKRDRDQASVPDSVEASLTTQEPSVRFRKISVVHKMTKGLVWHCENHHPNRAGCYYPALCHDMLSKTFLSSEIFQEVPDSSQT